MSRIPPPFFTLSIKAGSVYETTIGTVTVVKSGKLKTPDAGSSVMVEYIVEKDGEIGHGQPAKQYEFKKWLWDNMNEDQRLKAKEKKAVEDTPPPTPPVPPVPPANDPPAPPVPPLNDPPSPPVPPVPPIQDPPKPKRGMFDWMDDIYDFLFG
jgi:hypothetical protein